MPRNSFDVSPFKVRVSDGRLRRRTFAAYLTGSALFAQADPSTEVEPANEDSVAIDPPTQDTQVHCFGRYLIDLPQGFVPSGSSEATFFIGLDADHDRLSLKLIKSGLSQADFISWTKEMVAKWDAKIKYRPRDQPDRLLAKTVDYGDERLLYTRIRLSDAVNLRYLGFRGDTAFELSEEALSGESEIAQSTKRLLNLAGRTNRILDPLKSEPGTCYDNLLISGRYDEEVVNLAYRSVQYPDFRFKVFFAGIQRQAEEDNPTRNRRVTKLLGIPTIYSRTYAFQGMTANEDGMRFPSETEDSKMNYAYQFETRREDGSIRRPLIRIRMDVGALDNGKQIGTDKSQDQVQAIWQAVIKSLRPRPGAI